MDVSPGCYTFLGVLGLGVGLRWAQFPSGDRGRPIEFPQKPKMANPALTIVPPAVTGDDIDDPTTVSAGIELIDQDVIQLQSQPLRARRLTIRLGAARPSSMGASLLPMKFPRMAS
jgi:hypothetical protein